MRCSVLALALAACTHGSSAPRTPTEEPGAHSSFVADDEPPPAYDKAAISKALIAERAAEARGERAVADAEASDNADGLITARADLAVRRRFIAMLERCEEDGRLCPPRLDEPPWPYPVDSDADPKLDVPLRFDDASWPRGAAAPRGPAV